MGKIGRHINLDPDIDAAARARGVNVSDLCNQYLRAYLLNDQQINVDVQRKKLESELLAAEKNTAEIRAQLSRINSIEEIKKQQQEAEELKEQEEMFDAIKRSGRLGDLIR